MPGRPKSLDPDFIDADTFVGSKRQDSGGERQLVVVGTRSAKAHTLPGSGNLKIGRHKANDIKIDESSISRFHAVLHLTGSTITIEDLGSANGTRVGGSVVKPGKPAAVGLGETFHLGEVAVLIQSIDRSRK